MHPGADPRFTGIVLGVVVDRNDPDDLGRVRVRVPGLLEPASTWALPMGTVGGGSSDRGVFAVPEVDADVGVMFLNADPDRPVYFGGHWGRPNGTSEVPEVARDKGSDDDGNRKTPNIRSFESRRFRVVLNDNAGEESVRLEDKVSGDLIELDGAQRGMYLRATSAIILECVGLIDIRGLAVQINGRPVMRSPKAI